MNRNNSSDSEEEDSGNSWLTAATVGAGLAAVAGGLYLWANRSSGENNQSKQAQQPSIKHDNGSSHSSTSSYLSGLMNRANMRKDRIEYQASGMREESIPETPYINNLDTLRDDIYKRFVAVKRKDFSHHYQVFDTIFLKIHHIMQRVDPYYQKYSSTESFSDTRPRNLLLLDLLQREGQYRPNSVAGLLEFFIR